MTTEPAAEGDLVVVREEELAGWLETIHLLRSPKNAERLMASERQVKAGAAWKGDRRQPCIFD